MDLGIKGKRAIVCASSQGLGLACATSLAREGCSVVINGRDAGRLETARQEIEKLTGHSPTMVVADINTQEGRSALLAACPDADILVTNNAGPPPGELKDWNEAAWMKALESNMLAPFFLIQALLPGMRARKFGRIVNITSAMVKSPNAPLGLSTAARAGLTAVCKAIQRDAVKDNVTINNILPERFDTARQRFMVERQMKATGKTREEVMAAKMADFPARRLGRPEEFGDMCAFACSQQAAYMSGQNIQLDGGSYRGLV